MILLTYGYKRFLLDPIQPSVLDPKELNFARKWSLQKSVTKTFKGPLRANYDVVKQISFAIT